MVDVEKALSEKHGPFLLFALFQREDAMDLWDIVISADWSDSVGERKLMSEVVQEIQKDKERIDVMMISMIVILKPSNPLVAKITRSLAVSSRPVKLENVEFDDLLIKQAIVIAAKKTGK